METEILNIYDGLDIYKEKRIQMNYIFNEYNDGKSSTRLYNIISNNK